MESSGHSVTASLLVALLVLDFCLQTATLLGGCQWLVKLSHYESKSAVVNTSAAATGVFVLRALIHIGRGDAFYEQGRSELQVRKMKALFTNGYLMMQISLSVLLMSLLYYVAIVSRTPRRIHNPWKKKKTE